MASSGGIKSWLGKLFSGSAEAPAAARAAPPDPPKAEFVELILALDAEGIESARDEVTTEDVPALVRFYFELEEWPQKTAIVDLICDQHHPDMEALMIDVLRAPGGGDWVELPKAIALGYLSEDNDQFMRYYNDRELLARTVDEVLASHGLTLAEETTGPEGAGTSAATSAESAAGASPATDDPDAALLAAIRGGDLRALTQALAAGADPNARSGGDPALCAAIMGGHGKLAVALLRAGADPNATREIGQQSALWWAAGDGDLEVVDALLAKGATVDARDQWGANPLQQAASSGHVEVLRLLLRRGADLHTPYHDGRSVLNFAIRGGQLAGVKALLDAGADLQSKQSVFTPLAFACFEGTTPMVKLLVQRGADVEQTIDYQGLQGATPLMLAAQAGKVKMVEALLAGGADPSRRDRKGRTAADYAQGKRADAVRAALARR